MTLLKIARMGHPVLLQRAMEIPDPTADEIQQLAKDMLETMEDADGAGLAAPQVHVGLRMIIFKAPRGDGPEAVERSDDMSLNALINPEYEAVGDDERIGWEGCLSVPGLTGAVPRFTRIRYRGVNLDGEPIEREASGFRARVVQHEIDHLDGILYPVRMTDLKFLAFTEEMNRYMAIQESGDAPPEAEAPAQPVTRQVADQVAQQLARRTAEAKGSDIQE